MQGGTRDPGGWRRVASGARHARIKRNVIGRHGADGTQPTDRRRMAGNTVVSRRDMPGVLAGCVGPIVASHANARGRRPVVNEGSGSPGVNVVTLVAIEDIPVQIGRRLMVGRFEKLVGALHVAAGIGASVGRYTDVVKTGRKPDVGTVAIIAGAGQFQSRIVACRAARCYPAVMASCALSRLCLAMVIACSEERMRIEVAGIARCIGHDVCGGFRRCHNPFSQRMARRAVLWRSLEYAANVATFAGSRRVGAPERKAGGIVIEVARDL